MTSHVKTVPNFTKITQACLLVLASRLLLEVSLESGGIPNQSVGISMHGGFGQYDICLFVLCWDFSFFAVWQKGKEQHVGI